VSAPTWTLLCSGGCGARVENVPIHEGGEPDYSKLPKPWRRFSYESKRHGGTRQANVCSDLCESHFRAARAVPEVE